MSSFPDADLRLVPSEAHSRVRRLHDQVDSVQPKWIHRARSIREANEPSSFPTSREVYLSKVQEQSCQE
jgi:hypothetical protein